MRFTNASHTAGYIPLVVLKGYINEKNYYLYVSKTENGWQIDGLCETIGSSEYIPMDSEVFTHERDEIAYTTVSSMTDAVYHKTTLLPISDFCHLDNSTADWGMTICELPLSELPEPNTYEPYYTLTDIYGSTIDITETVQSAVVLLGDADGDGSVTILDATAIQRWLAEFTVIPFNEKAACITDDIVNILDATAIQRYLAGFSDPYHIGEYV